MLRISWPLAVVVGLVIVVVARRPRMLVPILIVFAIWFVWEQRKRKK